MGIKAGPGTYTFTPTSPAGQSYLVTVSADGNTMTHDGIAHVWDNPTGKYMARIPPNSNPPGEWHTIELHPDEGFDIYQMYDANVWVETGKAYHNG